MGNSESLKRRLVPIFCITPLQQMVFDDVKLSQPHLFDKALSQIFAELTSLGEDDDQKVLTEIRNLPTALVYIIHEVRCITNGRTNEFPQLPSYDAPWRGLLVPGST